jgi:sugar O-acyltransferase (sialic acid O-acetyltransferase NeuD family)
MLRDQNYKEKEIVFIDDTVKENPISGLPCEKIDFDEIIRLGQKLPIVIAQGDPQIRQLVALSLSSTQFELASIIDRTALIRGRVRIEKGVVVSALSIISDGSTLAPNVFINSSTVIGHDVIIGENSSISSQVNIGGKCKIGENVFIGSGAKIRDGITIGNNSVISAGSVVLKDIESNVVALGNPAKPIALNLRKSPFQ